MQTDKSKDLDVKGIALFASLMQNIYLPKLMRSGYVKKEGEQYALTEGGLSHYTEAVRSQVALEKRIEDMMRQGI
jgi:predicted transcriptional regulator